MEKLLERLELSWPIMFLARPDIDEDVLFVYFAYFAAHRTRNERTDFEEFFSRKMKKAQCL